MRSSVLALIVVLSLCSAVHAIDRYANSSNYQSRLAAAVPGDRVILAPGTYGHLWLSGKDGAAGNLIQIIAQDPTNRPVVLNPGLEGWQIYDSSYLLFDGIVMQGAQEEGFHLQSGGLTNHIIMRNCDVTMQSASGNTDCWKSDQTYDTLFYNCRASTCGDCGFDHMDVQDTLIMRSYMTNTGNSAVHAKNGSSNVGFYRNVHVNSGERSLQFGGNGMYATDQVAMGNVLIGSPYSAVYTTVQECDFAYNTVVDPTSAVMRFLNENPGGGVPTAHNSFTNNLVQYTSSTWASGPNTEPWTTTFADNFWSKTPSLPAPETGTVVGNPNLDGEYRPLNPAAKDYGAHAPGMEEAFQAWRVAHTDPIDGVPFEWAWSYAVDYDPDAEAGGAYTVYKHGSLGGSVQLDGTGSYAGNNPNADLPNYHQNVISAHGWDLDGDNVFGDAAGTTPTVTYADLVGYGRGAAGTYQIELAITVDTDYDDMKDWDTAQLIVAEAPNGDANFDGCADGLDYVVWSSNYKQSGNWGDADFNGDASVDGLDYVIWSNNYLQGCPASPGAVPEPATLSLLALGGLALLRRRSAQVLRRRSLRV